MIANPLQARIDELVRKWRVTVEQMFETESSFVAFGTRHHEPVVVKVIKRLGDEWHSGEILEAFQGRGVVRVYEHVEGALLLERARPGRPLVRYALAGKDEESTTILADVIQRMAGCTPPERCATIQDWAEAFERYAATGDSQIAQDLLDDGRRWYARLAISQRDTTLLHGDLHHYNVLSDERRGWLAVDPKGVAGEVEYEVGAALRNPIEDPDLFTSPKTIESRVKGFARSLNLDMERALAWGFAQAVLSAIWEIEDGCSVGPKSPVISLANTMRAMLASAS